MFVDHESFTFLNPLENDWQKIKDEMLSLDLEKFSDWPEPIYNGDWKVFPLYAYGKKVDYMCSLCPVTTSLVEKIPGMTNAGFSRLASGTHITPHVGYTDKVLRFHLGLTQAENCGLRVGSEIKYWHPGSAFLFDDTTEHEAWNRGGKDRIVLIVDFKRDVSEEVVFPDETREYVSNFTTS